MDDMRRLVKHGFYSTASPAVDAVLLLNSPSIGQWEFDEWLRLKHLPEKPIAVCADGAYTTLNTHFARQQSSPVTADVGVGEEWRPRYVCGDFDSIHLPSASIDPKDLLEFETFGDHNTHDDIRARLGAESRRRDDNWQEPTFVRLKDQNCTDFDKCLQLIRLLRYPPPPSANLGSDIDAFTSVVVIGASGGRLDHELAALNTIANFSQHGVHATLSTRTHTTFCCQPNAVTEFSHNPDFEGDTCGLIPLCAPTENVSIQTKGLKWNFEPGWTRSTKIGWGAMLSTSNKVDPLGGKVTIDTRGENTCLALFTIERRK